MATKIRNLVNLENRSVVTECACDGQLSGCYERFVADIPFLLPFQLLADEICTEYCTAALTELPPTINVSTLSNVTKNNFFKF